MEIKIPEYSEYKTVLEKRLTEKRYRHSLCVADEALRLAKKYGGDCQKAYLAGLLHDITKNAPEAEHFAIFELYGIKPDAVTVRAEKLWHAVSGAEYVKQILKIDDADIYDAIRYHTTAKADMPLLSEILYLADFTSADRDYEDVDVLRALVEKSLDAALKYALVYSIKELAEGGKAIHTDTVAAYNQAVML